MASLFDSSATPEDPAPTGAPRCPGCGGPLSALEEGVCSDCADELSRIGETGDTARDTWEPGEGIPRGLPRPIYKGSPLPWAEKSERISPFGDPLDSDRAQNDDRLDDGFWLDQTQLQDASRLEEAWKEGLCVLCGEPLGDYVYFFADGEELAQGGLHPRCARLTRAHCPGVSDGCWEMCLAPRAAWDDLRRAAPAPGTDYPDLFAPLPEEHQAAPVRKRRSSIP